MHIWHPRNLWYLCFISTERQKIVHLTQQDQYDRVSPKKPVSRVNGKCPKCGLTRTYILLINLSLLTGLPFFPPAVFGVSVHISFTFSNTILQWRSNALTLARSLRLLRHDIRTCVCDRTAVWRIERGPDVNSCSSS